MLDFWPGVMPRCNESRVSKEMSVLSWRELNFCFFHSFGKLVTQTRFLIIYMVFIGIPAPHRITFQGVVPSSSIELFLQIWAFRLDESSIFNIAPWSIRKNVTITFREVAQRNRSENSPLAAARHHFLKLCEFINMHLVIRQITSPAPPSPKPLSQGS